MPGWHSALCRVPPRHFGTLHQWCVKFLSTIFHPFWGWKYRIGIFDHRAAKRCKKSWREIFGTGGAKFRRKILSPDQNFRILPFGTPHQWCGKFFYFRPMVRLMRGLKIVLKYGKLERILRKLGKYKNTVGKFRGNIKLVARLYTHLRNLYSYTLYAKSSIQGLTKKFPDEFYLQKYSTLIRYINVVPFKVFPSPRLECTFSNVVSL